MTTIENIQTAYQALPSYPEDTTDFPPQDRHLSDVLIQHVEHKTRWNHIENLDEFFSRIYHYHQNNGFLCMMAKEVLELAQFVFIVVFSVFLIQCVDYDLLFANVHHNVTSDTKIGIPDVVLPASQCLAHTSAFVVVCILVACIFWALRLIKVIYHFFHYLEIKAFYCNALKIAPHELSNLTWHEVQHRLTETQKEQQMCVHKQELSELDIYNRILRFKNYMIALVNKSVLPLHFNLPFIGSTYYFSQSLKYNIEMILFWGPWSPFQNSWHLKDDYKRQHRRRELAEQLAQRILYIGIANLILSPLILLWQILYSFYNYAEIIKREPGSLGARQWSLYGRLYLRHFNELDHEFNARLNRGYRPATRYMNIFVSPLLAVIAQNIAFLCGSVLAVLIVLTIYDEDVLTVEHILSTMTLLGVVVTICRVFIPDEHLVFCPETLLTATLAHIHYIPDSWKGAAHTSKVRDQFSQLFQFKIVYLLFELLSPIVTPYILCCQLRYKALDIVDIFRNFTVEVVGVGDVCSFAQMDVRKHGNTQWMVSSGDIEANNSQQAENGKTELSLMHFTMTNPNWKPPESSNQFVENIKQKAQRDLNSLQPVAENALYQSLCSMSSIGYNLPVGPSLHASMQPTQSNQQAKSQSRPMQGGLNRSEGPLQASAGILGSMYMTGSLGMENLFSQERIQSDAVSHANLTAIDMSLSTLYLHELHHRRTRYGLYQDLDERDEGPAGPRHEEFDVAEEELWGMPPAHHSAPVATSNTVNTEQMDEEKPLVEFKVERDDR